MSRGWRTDQRPRICSIGGEQVSYDFVAKGFEIEGGQMVVTDEDLAELPTKSSREITVEKFVPTEQWDEMLLDLLAARGEAS